MYYQATNSEVTQALHHMIEDIEEMTCPNEKDAEAS